MLLGWERKILRSILGPIGDNNVWRIRNNKEIQDLYGDADLVTYVKKQRMQWTGHVERMADERPCRRLFRGKS